MDRALVPDGIVPGASTLDLTLAWPSHPARRDAFRPSTPERPGPVAEDEFFQAMEAYKTSSGRMFPTWSEVLEVLRNLGYVKSQAGGGAGGR